MHVERQFKGSSLLQLTDDYTCIDIETTGLDPLFDNIIELAAVRVRGGQIVDRFQQLVNPEREIGGFITDLTGITDEMLKDAPTLEQCIRGYIKFIGSDEIIVGHNVNFDINFIYDDLLNLTGAVFSNDFIDTMRISRRLFRGENHHRLTDLIKRFDIGTAVEHRALGDATQTHLCYEYIKVYMYENNISPKMLTPYYSGKNYSPKAKDIIPETMTFDETSTFYKRVFAFTGMLEKMPRWQAMQEVVNRGGLCEDNVTKKLNYLVLGCNDYCPTIKDGKSRKQKQAEQYKLNGQDIEIISENTFYDMLQEYDTEAEDNFVRHEEIMAMPSLLEMQKKSHKMDQFNMFNALQDDITEEAIYRAIEPALRNVLVENNIHDDALTFEKYSQYSSASFLSFLLFRVYVLKTKAFISVSKDYDKQLNEAPFGLPDSEGFRRMQIKNIEDAKINADIFADILRACIDKIPKDFDCCHLYAECSDAKQCVNPDKSLALLCGYRKIIKLGKVFYGKNRTVDK